ncbi:MAG: desulfoferrodoxin family protein [Coriobacteriales bacterium]|jgi:superoxide reductase
MSQVKFYKCNICGRIVGVIVDSGSQLVCCGQPMEELVPNTVDAAAEKHVPVISTEGTAVNVKVGEVEHPMVDDHYIQWIYIKTEQGGQHKSLKPGDKPEAVFELAGGDKLVAAYAYCNKHGLWMAEA